MRWLITLSAVFAASCAIAQGLNGGIAVPAGGRGQIFGTRSNDSAAPGDVGEIITGTATAGSINMTSPNAINVTSVALSAGDWDCRGVVSRTLNAATSVTELVQSISQTTGTLSGSLIDGSTTQLDTAANVMVGNTTLPVGPFRVSLAANTTVFLVAKDTFTVNTDATGGSLSCRRVR